MTCNFAHPHKSDLGLLAELLEEQSSPKMGDSLPRMPMNHRAKFILGGEIRYRTNKQNYKHHTLPIGMCG